MLSERLFLWLVGFAVMAFFYQVIYPRIPGRAKNILAIATDSSELRSLQDSEWASAAREAFLARNPFEESGSEGERLCREILENRYDRPFVKSRPVFLRHPDSGQYLELDCFNQDLRLAVEYNGRQHYEYVPYFHATPEAFEALKERDATKARLCYENGVHLIVVPHYVDVRPYLELRLSEFDASREAVSPGRPPRLSPETE